jgi:hypothetical protein
MPKARVAAILLGALLVVALYGSFWYCVQRPKAAGLDLIETLRAGTRESVATLGSTRVLMATRWKESAVSTRQVGPRALIVVGAGGERVEMLDDGARLWQLGATPKVLGASGRPADWLTLRTGYKVVRAPARTLAGHKADGYRVISRRTGKVAERFWISWEGLILARETSDADGHLVSRSEVTQMTPAAPGVIEKEIEAAVTRLPKPPADEPVTDEAFEARAGFRPVRPTLLPEGYTEAGLFARTCEHGRVYAELRYTDGLRVLTIHERPGGGPGRGQGRGLGHRHGAQRHASAEPVLVDQGQAKMVRVIRGRVHVYLTGDLTQAEMLALAGSIP